MGVLRFWRKALTVAAAALFLAVTANSHAGEGLQTYFSVAIEMPTHEFKLGEPIKGKVTIENRAVKKLSGNFEVKLYKEDELKYSTTVHLKTVYSGTNEFRFKSFGIPDIDKDESSLGLWRIMIHQINRPQDAVIEAFRIIADSKD